MRFWKCLIGLLAVGGLLNGPAIGAQEQLQELAKELNQAEEMSLSGDYSAAVELARACLRSPALSDSMKIKAHVIVANCIDRQQGPVAEIREELGKILLIKADAVISPADPEAAVLNIFHEMQQQVLLSQKPKPAPVATAVSKKPGWLKRNWPYAAGGAIVAMGIIAGLAGGGDGVVTPPPTTSTDLPMPPDFP
jgi:hypothetical protein